LVDETARRSPISDEACKKSDFLLQHVRPRDRKARRSETICGTGHTPLARLHISSLTAFIPLPRSQLAIERFFEGFVNRIDPR
jgi:hypothetical protein